MLLTNLKTLKPFWHVKFKKKYDSINALNSSITQSSLKTPSKINILRTIFDESKIHLKYKVNDVISQDESTNKLRAKKLKLRPTKEQKILLNQWAGCTRFLYNKTIATLTNPKSTIKNKFALRNRFATIKNQKTKKLNSFYNNKDWLKNCPNGIRQFAIYDAKSNLQSCFTNLKEKNIQKFNKPFRTKKKEQLNGYCYAIEKLYIKKNFDKLIICQKHLGEMKYYGTKQLHKLIPNEKPIYDCKIQKTSFGEYFLIIPYDVKAKKIPKIFKNPVSIDPGIRKVITTYAPNEKESYMIGNKWTTKLMDVLIPLDNLYSQRVNDKSKKLKNQIIRLRKRVFYLKKEMRDQTANFISKKYDLILMPKLETGKLSEKATRRLKNKTVRVMLSIGHSKLFDSVKEKCWEHGSKFLHVEESYTSQTCPNCGNLHKTSSEIYKCSKCSFTHDRDIIGALNILLKALV